MTESRKSKELHGCRQWSAEDLNSYECRFCNGQGIDRFGIMSPLSTCTACGGRARFRLSGPVKDCAYCSGSGVNPRSARNPCLACGGSGLQKVKAESSVCPSCSGSGSTENRVWYCFSCHGAGVSSRHCERSDRLTCGPK